MARCALGGHSDTSGVSSSDAGDTERESQKSEIAVSREHEGRFFFKCFSESRFVDSVRTSTTFAFTS